jgi:hypothetical protein
VRAAYIALLAGAGLLQAATGATAEPWACEFTVECITGEPCGAAAYQITILAADHEGRLFLSSVVGDTPVTRLNPDAAPPVSYASAGRNGLAEMITIEADSTALMTAHIFDGSPMAVTYFGTCEAL